MSAPTGGAVGAFQISLFERLFASIAQEMGVTLQRSSFSPNIKERRDFSCAVFDRRGRIIAQAAHIPVHLGAMPMSVAAAIELFDQDKAAPGDLVILNDPYRGGTHLPGHNHRFAGLRQRRRRPDLVRVRGNPSPPRRRWRNEPGIDGDRARDIPGGTDHPAGKTGPRRFDRARGAGPDRGQRAHPDRAARRPYRPAGGAPGCRASDRGHRGPVRPRAHHFDLAGTHRLLVPAGARPNRPSAAGDVRIRRLPGR